MGEDTATIRCVTVLVHAMALTVLLWGSVEAESGWEGGAKLGSGLSYMWGPSRDASYGSELAYSFGAFLVRHSGEQFSLQAELLYTATALRRRYSLVVPGGAAEFSETDRLTYLQIPLIAKFPFPVKTRWRPSVYAGGAGALKLKGRASADFIVTGSDRIASGKFNTNISNARSIDFGPVFGADVTVPVSATCRLQIDFRHWLGCNRIFKNVNSVDESGSAPVADLKSGVAPEVANSTTTLSLGVQWHLK